MRDSYDDIIRWVLQHYRPVLETPEQLIARTNWGNPVAEGIAYDTASSMYQQQLQLIEPQRKREERKKRREYKKKASFIEQFERLLDEAKVPKTREARRQFFKSPSFLAYRERLRQARAEARRLARLEALALERQINEALNSMLKEQVPPAPRMPEREQPKPATPRPRPPSLAQRIAQAVRSAVSRVLRIFRGR